MKQKKERNTEIKRHGDIIIIITAASLIFLAFFSTALILKLMSERRRQGEESSVVDVIDSTESEESNSTTEESSTTIVTTTEPKTESISESITTTTSTSVSHSSAVSLTVIRDTTKSTTKGASKTTTAVRTQAATKSYSGYKVTQEEIALLRKLVANEYGADWVPVKEKAKIVASIMAQVKDKRFPNTVKGCIYKTCVPYGFNPNKRRTISKSVIAAVDYYFANANTVFKNWTANSWWGDGKYNHFRRV